MSDPRITDAWIADSSYLDTTGSVGVWRPQKGTISLIQGTAGSKPTYSAAWGSGNKGQLTFDGVNDWMSGDALAAKVTGNKPWTIIIAYQLVSLVAFEETLSFSNTSFGASFHVFQPDSSSPKKLRVSGSDDLGARRDGVTTYNANTSRSVATVSFDEDGNYGLRINASDVALPDLGSPLNIITLSKFTIGAVRDSSSAAGFASQKVRAVLFMPQNFLAAACRPPENYLIAEMA